MKPLVLALAILTAYCSTAFAQVQPQGEYHRTAIKKAEMERRKAKTKELYGAGVIMFSYKEIPREGKTKEVEPILTNTFKSSDKFIGRIYLPRNVGRMEQIFPDAIIFKTFVDNGKPFFTEVPRSDMPDVDWSSWMVEFPDKFKEAMSAASGGNHTVRIELWSGYIITPEDEAAMIKAEEEQAKKDAPAASNTVTPKKAPPKKPAPKKVIGTGPHGRLWAIGEFNVTG